MDERNYKNGFTLVEVLVALFLLSVIFSILYSAFFPTRKVINTLEERGEYLRVMEGTIQILSHDIRAAAIPDTNSISIFKGDREGTKQPIIALSSYTPYQEAGIGRLRKIEYHVEDDPGMSGSFVLRRLVYKGEQEVVEDEVLIDGLSRIELSYFDGNEWKDEWDARDSKVLPKGVKVNITSEGGEITSVIPIEAS